MTWQEAVAESNVVQLRSPVYWVWTSGQRRSWTVGTTQAENTAEFRLHMALYSELGERAHKALRGRY